MARANDNGGGDTDPSVVDVATDWLRQITASVMAEQHVPSTRKCSSVVEHDN